MTQQSPFAAIHGNEYVMRPNSSRIGYVGIGKLSSLDGNHSIPLYDPEDRHFVIAVVDRRQRFLRHSLELKFRNIPE